MMRFEVFDNRYTFECGYGGERDDIDGPFPLGLQTPVSVQEALQWHHMASPMSREVFSSYTPCKAHDRWESGPWEVVKDGQVVASGEFDMSSGHPVLRPELDEPGGRTRWDVWRVNELAQQAVGGSRKASVGSTDGGVLVNLKRKDGKWEPVMIADTDLHVTKMTDEEVVRRIEAKLRTLADQGQ